METPTLTKNTVLNPYVNEPIHDREESQLVVAIYHQKKWMSPKGMLMLPFTA
jgi:hypothetical protein